MNVKIERGPSRRLKWNAPIEGDAPEAAVVNAIRGAANRLPWCRLWLNKERYIQGKHGPVHVPGLAEGSADLVGIVSRAVQVSAWETRTLGVFVAIECKAPRKRTRVSDAQHAWGALVEQLGGVWGHAHTPLLGVEILARARGTTVAGVLAELEAINGGPLGWT